MGRKIGPFEILALSSQACTARSGHVLSAEPKGMPIRRPVLSGCS
jgi:hypothetical protein